MRKVFLLGLICVACAAMSFAADAKFSIAANSQLTEELLDSCWANRETVANQKIIADYLLTNPAVPNDYAKAWKTARLVSFIGSYGADAKKFGTTPQGVQLFDYGVKAAQIATTLQPNQIEGVFWYAVDLGSYDAVKGGIGGASKWIDAVKQANAIDPTYYYYGSNRMLGVYYQILPGILGGSNSKALQYLTTATIKAPQFRNNWLTLGQYYLNTKDYKNALANCQKVLTLPKIDGKFEEMKYTRDANKCISAAQAKLN